MLYGEERGPQILISSLPELRFLLAQRANVFKNSFEHQKYSDRQIVSSSSQNVLSWRSLVIRHLRYLTLVIGQLHPNVIEFIFKMSVISVKHNPELSPSSRQQESRQGCVSLAPWGTSVSLQEGLSCWLDLPFVCLWENIHDSAVWILPKVWWIQSHNVRVYFKGW